MSAVAPPLDLRDAFAQAGQGQVFRFWEQLSAAERAALIAQAREIDLAELARLTSSLLKGGSASAVDLADLEPAPYEALPENGGDASAWAQARAAGEEARRPGGRLHRGGRAGHAPGV